MIIEQTPPNRKPAHGQPEAKIQSESYVWFYNTFPEWRGLLFAVTNQNERSGDISKRAQAISGAMRRQMGVYAGVSDLILLIPNGIHFGLMLECKTAVGRQSDAQKEWQKKVESVGYRYEIFRSKEEFINLVTNYLNDK